MKISSSTQRVVVTGADGFIGKELVKALERSGAIVFPITRKVSRDVSLFNVDSLRIFLNDVKPTSVVHLANRRASKLHTDNLISISEENIQMAENLISAMATSNTNAHFVQIGSCAEYGAVETPYEEITTPFPISAYGKAKLAITNHLKSVAGGIEWTVLRPSVVYGPGQVANMFIPSVVRAMKTNSQINLTSCDQYRDFIFVSDIVGGIMSTISHRDRTSREIINLASGKSYILKNVAIQIANFFPQAFIDNLKFDSLIAGEGDVHDYRVDVSKAKNMIGWIPLVDLELGLAKVIDE